MEDRTSTAPSSSSMSHEHRDAGTRKRKRSTPSTNGYQVFINHRGPDVKKTLASLIYRNLQVQGVQVFLDKDEFQPGQPLKPTIQEVISACSVHVAIFSRRYAESSWCLDELCLMLESGASIIPVFYDVTPSDLRCIEKGGYASAFVDHEKKGRVDSQTISAWKSALSQAAGISGLDLQSDTINGDWGKLLESLEDAVLKNLKPVPPEATIYLAATYPVGLDESIRDFESFIESRQQNENKEVKIVGIVGLGGSGKTTLATEFFNRKNSSFQKSSFLSDLRDASNRKALTDLQSKFLKDLQLGDHKFGSVSEGTRLFIEKLQDLTTPVLIVLDDIDHANQVEALLGEAVSIKKMLRSGSLIIITSRDKGALKLSGASFIYRIKALRADHAQDLFCHYAFQQRSPLGGFEDLVEKFCEKCGRLPLFLKVMGAHLRINAMNDRQLWEDELKYIHEDILKVLNASYNSLLEPEKHIFLDITCFFIGEDKSLAIKVWDKCEGRGLLRLNILVNKCLVEFDSDNRFKMHDHVRDFGREIADKESPCRMWNESQAANFREQPKETKIFHGIMAARSYIDVPLAPWRFDTLQWYEPPLEEIELLALKILIVQGYCFKEQIGRKLKNLAWLRWFECPYASISPWLISMKNLTVLEIIGGDIEEWPLAVEQVHLRELRIVWTGVSKISLRQYPHLELFDLRCNAKLAEIKHLPETLAEFNLEGCENVKELQSVQNLPKLRQLNIYRCSGLRGLPKLQQMPSLETLEVFDCDNLQDIQGLEDLPQLRQLNIFWCRELRGLPKLQQMPSLEELKIQYCNRLQDIQGLEDLPQLRQLSISGCPELRGLPKLQQMPSLESLKIEYCDRLQDIQGL